MRNGTVNHTNGFVGSGRPAPLVVKLGGAAIEEGCERTFAALARLHRAEPGGVVLVHGGGKAVDRRLARLGLKSQRKEGVRLTPPDHLDEVVAVLAGSVNTAVVGGLQRHGAAAVGLCLGDGFFASARKSDKFAFDPGRVGMITGGNPALLNTLLGAGFLPVLSSIALDDRGEALNINADEAAAGVAGLLGARALILLTDTPGILDAAGSLVRSVTEAEAEAKIAAGEITNGMIPKVRGAALAARAANAPAWIASAADPENLERLAHGEGEGTRVLPAPRAHAAARHERVMVGAAAGSPAL